MVNEKTAIKPRLRERILRRPAAVLSKAPMQVDSGVDLEALEEKLFAIDSSKTEVDKRSEAIVLLKDALEEALDQTQNMFDGARLGGLETALRISAAHTDILIALYHFTTQSIIPKGDQNGKDRIAVCAVGGFGRGEMAPSSDLDLLFLQSHSKPSAWGASVTEFMLYMLWDLGLKVGQSSRSVEQCLKLAKEDQTILTALLDCRFIVGDAGLALTLRAKFRQQINKGRGSGFIAAKLDERDVRHTREGNSRYVIEPNIKEGKGGLRDLHALYWIARYLDKDGQIVDPQRAQDYVDMGLFDSLAADRFVRAADYLWRARIHLHYEAGRPVEHLTFDYQTKLARKMGYASGPVEVAVEKFMKEYFTNAREVGALTRIACAKIEQENSQLLPKGLDRLLPTSRRALKAPGFVLDHGRLSFDDEMKIKDDPSLILQLFYLAGTQNLDIHPNALSAIDFRRNLIDNNFRKDPKHANIFLNTLLESPGAGTAMKVMNEAGVLGRYLLEFGGIVAQTQFNMHHAYTVDEHTIGLVRYFNDLERDNLTKGNPVATEFVKGFTESQRRILYMACLLHDTGKGVGDQCIEGARLSRRACRRMGMADEEVDTISWLIRRHLDMSDTAQRRDISDPETIKAFAENVGSIERLQLLMALTIVDIRAVGPGIWNDWKGSLLRDLYASTASYLDDKPNIAPISRAKAARETLFERLPESVSERVQKYMSTLDDSYWLSTSVTEQVRHARFVSGAIEAKTPDAVHARVNKKMNVTELWVKTKDRTSLFSDLTGAMTSAGASITGARLHTAQEGQVFDIFYLQNADGKAFGAKAESLLESLRDKTLRAARGDAVQDVSYSNQTSRRARAIPVEPCILFEDRDAKDVVVLQVEGRDRPGLLYDIARVFADKGLVILSAHIEVIGEKAIDVFYLEYLPGTDEWRTEKRDDVRKSLLEVLSPEITA